jgi:hypothetical protein
LNCIKTLQFVAETGVARPNGSFRDLIRSKARRKGKKQGESSKSAGKSSSGCFLGILEPDSERSRTTTPISSGHVTPKNSPKSPLTLQGVEDCLIDPFLTLPISNSGGTQFLLHHCEYFSDGDHCSCSLRTISVHSTAPEFIRSHFIQILVFYHQFSAFSFLTSLQITLFSKKAMHQFIGRKTC